MTYKYSRPDHDAMVKVLCALQLRARSEEDADDELLSVAVVKDGNKAVVGAGSGVLSLYSWGYFNDCSDRFPGEPLHNRVVYGRLSCGAGTRISVVLL